MTIAIASLTLGSVTQQALGPDYFAAGDHPTAVFTADILNIPDGYEARGTLTLRGAEVPVAFPFDLTVTDGQAEMQSKLTLNRMDFGIGQNMSDESSLAFAVEVAIALKAARAEN